MEHIKELKNMGLKDKEAAVYVSCLQLGPSPVQQISRKAKVVRATTYVILDTLMRQGLVTKFQEGKKTLYSAEPPHQLTRLLDKQQETLDDKRRELKVLLPHLQVVMKSADEKPSVRYFEGKEGLQAIRQEIVMYSKPNGMIYNITPIDHLYAVFADTERMYYNQRMAKGIRSNTLFTTKSAKLRKGLLSAARLKRNECRYISPKQFPTMSGMTIYRDRIAIGSLTGKLMGVVIENQHMADMMRMMFDLAWVGAEVIERRPQRRLQRKK